VAIKFDLSTIPANGKVAYTTSGMQKAYALPIGAAGIYFIRIAGVDREQVLRIVSP
jgi:hypothetical protein